MGNREIPFDPAGVQVRTVCGDNKNRISICSDHLVGTSFPEAPRVNTVFYGRMSTIVDAPGWLFSTTNSPTAGKRESRRKAPEIPPIPHPPS